MLNTSVEIGSWLEDDAVFRLAANSFEVSGLAAPFCAGRPVGKRAQCHLAQGEHAAPL
jgi:hypothetical protein